MATPADFLWVDEYKWGPGRRAKRHRLVCGEGVVGGIVGNLRA